RIAQFTVGACPPILGSDRCAPLNNDTFYTIGSTKPDVVLLHATWKEGTDLNGLRETISNLRQLGTPRIIIVGPVPYWKRTLPFLLVNSYRFQHRIPDRMTNSVSGSTIDSLMEAFSKGENVEYISAWKRFCNVEGCLTRTGSSAEDVVALDQVHLSDRGSEFLGEAIVSYLQTAKGLRMFDTR